MESQSGARTPLVDPFGRELEEWLRDAPATRAPYLSDLVVPPVTGPVQRPVAASGAVVELVETAPEPEVAEVSAPVDDSAFRRPRDRARHAAVCAPSFPEPPERLALRIEDLAVEVSAASGRTTIERIVLLLDEVRRRDEDLARLAAWEATVAEDRDPEVEAARAFARTVFADLLADAALEADRRDRAAARRAATGTVTVVAPTPMPARGTTSTPAAARATTPTPARATTVTALVEVTDLVDVIDEHDGVAEPTTPIRDVPVRPVLSLPVVSPVSAATRPTPLVQPATGPTVIDRAAFAAALTAHEGITSSTPVVLPDAVLPAATTTPEAPGSTVEQAEANAATQGWWARLVDRVLRALGRR